jgi:hypothetical protein
MYRWWWCPHHGWPLPGRLVSTRVKTIEWWLHQDPGPEPVHAAPEPEVRATNTGRPAPPVNRWRYSDSTRMFATPLTYPFLYFIQTHTWSNEIKICLRQLERDEIFTWLTKVPKFDFLCKYFVPLEFYNRIAWSFAYWPSWHNDMRNMLFPYSKSWSILFWNRKVRQLSFMLNLAKSYSEPYIYML